MITVHVPATSANIGAGFDALGLALSLGNTVCFEEAEGCHIESADGAPVPAGPENMVYAAARMLYQTCGRPFLGLRLVQESPIPATRGLGSSSACVAAGLVGANALMKNPCTRAELVSLAAAHEGHPDNVAPALLGGCVASLMEDGRVYSVKKEIPPTLCFAAFIPDFELPTHTARQALPRNVSHKDAVYNLQRAALCQAALCEGRLDLLPLVTQDRLHQPYRLPLIPGGEEIFALAKAAGARGVFISGAGPTILAVVDAADEGFAARAEAMLAAFREESHPAGRFAITRLAADNEGARVLY